MLDWILTEDNILSNQECEELINLYKPLTKFNKEEIRYYSFFDIDPNTFKYASKLNYMFEEYVKQYPEAGKTGPTWSLTTMRFKHFKPGQSFDNWHSENNMTFPYRVLALQIYLSDHNCGTEFSGYNKTIMSKKGRATLFPAYFTHTHKGHICPEKKDRYIITGYVNYIKKGIQ